MLIKLEAKSIIVETKYAFRNYRYAIKNVRWSEFKKISHETCFDSEILITLEEIAFIKEILFKYEIHKTSSLVSIREIGNI